MLILCPNLAIDHTIRIQALTPGAVDRARSGGSVAGGKGANVGRAARAVGADVDVIGFLPAIGRDHLLALFAAESIPLAGIEIDGVVRTCTAILEDGGRTTLINEPGAATGDADWAALLALVTDPPPQILGSGSLPPGAPTDCYAGLVELAHATGSRCSVDVGGEALLAAARAGADLLCPNLFEATSLTSGATTEEVCERGEDVALRALAAARGLRELGAATVAVTAGAAGVGLAWPDGERWLPTVPIVPRNPIGAGDSFLAGTIAARERDEPWPDAVRFGMAVAGSSVEHDGAGVIDPQRVDQLLAALQVAHARS